MAEIKALVIPKGRTAAEKRLGAIAALHQPRVVYHGVIRGMDLGTELICPECSRGSVSRAAWPCATVRLMGPWPGEVPES